MSKVIFSTEIWGEPYVTNYINYIYPNHLACLKQIENSDYEYWIYTSTEDLPKFEQIKEKNIVLIPDKHIENGVASKEFSIRLTLQKVSSMDGTMLFLPSADCLHSANSFSNLLELADTTDGQIFLIAPLRVNNSILPYLKDCDYSSRNLVRLALSSLHTKFKRHCIDTEFYTTTLVTVEGYIPSLLYWKFKDTGLLIRTFHPHSILLKRVPKPKSIDDYFFRPMDQGVYTSTHYSRNELFVIPDSDIALSLDIDMQPSLPLPPIGTMLNLPNSVWGNQISPAQGHNLTKEEIRDWADAWTHSGQREMMKHDIYIHSENLTEEWKELKSEVNKTMLEIYGDLLDRQKLPEWVKL